MPAAFLGANQQMIRHLVDDRTLGQIISGVCLLDQNRAGCAPDPGPDCIAAFVQALGPVERVVAMSATGLPSQVIPYKFLLGEAYHARMPAALHAILQFESGAQIIYGKHGIESPSLPARMELFGCSGALRLNNPAANGETLCMTKAGERVDLPEWSHPLAWGEDDDWTQLPCAGLADMAQSILDKRPHRCSVDFVLHVVEILEALHDSVATGSVVDLMTTCARPAALGPEDARELLA